MDVATIVIEQPYGTVLVTVDVPVGPIEGQLDSNTGANLVHAEGFGIDGDGIPYFRAGGAADGEQAALGLSGDGQVSLTRAGIPGGAMALRAGTHALIEQPSGPDPGRPREPGIRSTIHGEPRIEPDRAGRAPVRPEPGTHAQVEQPSGPDPAAPRRQPGTKSTVHEHDRIDGTTKASARAPREPGTRKPLPEPAHEAAAQNEPGTRHPIVPAPADVRAQSPEGTHVRIEQPSGPDPTRRPRPGSPVHGHERVERTSAEAPREQSAPGAHSPIPKPARPLSRLAKRLRRKRTDTK